jgi:EAL domain-containing protein (putative c-di-GMP-specific phosphodiesterase class I)
MDVPCSPRAAPLGSISPPPVPDEGVLYLRPPLGEPLAESLRAAGVPFAQPAPGVFAVPLAPGRLAHLAEVLPAVLTDAAVRGTRALVAADDLPPSLADLFATLPLAALLGAVRGRWLAEVLRDGRLVTHFQPIVLADDPGRVFGYECLVRGLTPAGALVWPRELFAAARGADLLPPLDRQARLTAIRTAARYAGWNHLFLNFHSSSLHHPGYCLRTTVEAVAEAGLDPARVVFEVVEDEEVRDPEHLLEALEVYRRAGFRVALDDVGAGYNSLNLLARLRPDFVKLDMGLVRGVDHDPYKARVAGKLLELTRELRVRTVAEGVETIAEWDWVRNAGADYAQGYLFARPASPPPTPAVPTAA